MKFGGAITERLTFAEILCTPLILISEVSSTVLSEHLFELVRVAHTPCRNISVDEVDRFEVLHPGGDLRCHVDEGAKPELKKRA